MIVCGGRGDARDGFENFDSWIFPPDLELLVGVTPLDDGSGQWQHASQASRRCSEGDFDGAFASAAAEVRYCCSTAASAPGPLNTI